MPPPKGTHEGTESLSSAAINTCYSVYFRVLPRGVPTDLSEVGFFCLSDGNFSAFARLFNKLNFGWWERDGWRWFLKVEDGPCSTPKSGERKDRHGHRLQGNTTEYCFCCCLMTFQRDVSQKALLWVLVNSEGVKSLMYFGTCNEGVWIINASSSVAFI